LTPALADLSGKVQTDDPYIQGLRVARHRPGVIRVALDLKGEVKPQVFSLKPIGDCGHRLVLDICPTVDIDPLAALIEEVNRKPAPAGKPAAEPLPGKGKPVVARLATVVIDAGHGG